MRFINKTLARHVKSGNVFIYQDNLFKMHYHIMADTYHISPYPLPDDYFHYDYIKGNNPVIEILTDMTPLAYQIGNLLLPICLAETAKAREVWKKPEPPVLTGKAKELQTWLELAARKILPNTGEHAEMFKALFIILEDKPEVKQEIAKIEVVKALKTIHPIYAPFTVIVVEQNYSGHGLILDVPRIVIHGKDRLTLGLDDDESPARHAYNISSDSPDETRVATDDEVETCVMSLTPKQLRYIMTAPLFAPVVNALYEEQTELVPEKEEDDIPFE